MKVKRRGRGHVPLLLSCSMTAFACVASADVDSEAMTFSIILMVVSLSPLFSATRPSLKMGLPHDGSVSAAF